MKNDTPAVDVMIELVASAIEELRSRPMTAKLLADEPELVASFIQHDVPDVIERFGGALGPPPGAGPLRGHGWFPGWVPKKPA